MRENYLTYDMIATQTLFIRFIIKIITHRLKLLSILVFLQMVIII